MAKKFTRQGFPKPDINAEYDQDEVVWVLVNPKMPYWPAQIKTNTGKQCTKYVY